MIDCDMLAWPPRPADRRSSSHNTGRKSMSRNWAVARKEMKLNVEVCGFSELSEEGSSESCLEGVAEHWMESPTRYEMNRSGGAYSAKFNAIRRDCVSSI